MSTDAPSIEKKAEQLIASKPEKATANNLGHDLARTLRGKLDAAILAEQWDAVSAINSRPRELERVDVIDLARERARRDKTSK